MEYILNRIIKTILSISSKTFADNPPIRIYVNKKENRITFRIKTYYITGYYLELLMPETIKLFGCNKSKITQDQNGENVPHLEIRNRFILK